VQKVGQGILTIAKHSKDVIPIVQSAERLANKAGHVLHNFVKSHRITKIEKAAEANARFGYPDTPPYKAGSRVVHFVTTKDTKWVRVHTDGATIKGTWMIKKGEVKGLNAEQIKDKLNLPTLPTHVSDVHVPKNTPMSRGSTHLNHWNGDTKAYTKEGQVQYRLEAEWKSISSDWFKNSNPIPPGGIQ
jgi:hypothetical protein